MRLIITDGFGEIDKWHKTPHTGIDIAMPSGTDIHAFASGYVERVLDTGSKLLGKSVWVRMHDGYTAVYGHLSDVAVKVGDHVYNGMLIAHSGNTGNSTGPHLHFAMLDVNNQWTDPSRYVFLDDVINANYLTYAGRGDGIDWAHGLVRSWFDAMGKAIGDSLAHIGHDMWIELNHMMPNVVLISLMVAAFLKMTGSKKWSTRFFITSGVLTGWVIMF